MKLALALSIALTMLAAPQALADQSVAIGPASASTTSSDVGDECGGDNGYHFRDAQARAELYPGESVGVQVHQYCSDQTAQWYETHGSGVFVMADHRVDNNVGPGVFVGYGDATMNGWRYCGLHAGVAGIPIALGCLPAGAKLPFLPALP